VGSAGFIGDTARIVTKAADRKELVAGTSPGSLRLRAGNIATRTVHIAVTGVLFGGHIFGIDAERLTPWLGLSILTGTILVVLEAYPSWRWCYEARAVMVMTKVLLMCTLFWLWNYRVPIMIAIIVLGSAGSHMPKRYRHYSLMDRRPPGDTDQSTTSGNSPPI
jgi:hypothetical protein